MRDTPLGALMVRSTAARVAMSTAVLVAMLVARPERAVADGLPSAPLVIQSVTLAAGSQGRILLEPRARASVAEPFDLYLVRIPSGPPVLRYLGPDGRWSEVVTPYRRSVGPGVLSALTATWAEDGPPGSLSLLAVFTRPGLVPSNRQAWPYQPELRRAWVDADHGAGNGAAKVLGPLAGVTLVALALVLFLPREPAGAADTVR